MATTLSGQTAIGAWFVGFIRQPDVVPILYPRFISAVEFLCQPLPEIGFHA